MWCLVFACFLSNNLLSLYICNFSANNSFIVSANGQPGQTYTLLANDELDKRHWLQQIQQAVQSQAGKTVAMTTAPCLTGVHRRRPSIVSETLSADDTSMNTSFTSLSSVFSTNSSSTISSQLSIAVVGTSRHDSDSDSGIVSKWWHLCMVQIKCCM